MSFPSIPTNTSDMDRDDALDLLIASVAFEELSLAHILNAEAEKIQYVLGTLDGTTTPVEAPSVDDLIEVNNTVNQTIRNIIKYQMLLQFKLEDASKFPEENGENGEFVEAGSAWSVGTDFGTGNAQYTTLGAEETENTVILGLGDDYTPVGLVSMVRTNGNLEVTISTISPYVMDEVHLYVSNAIPVDSNPGGFPDKYTVTNPVDYFSSHTFTVDVSAYAGQLLYIAAHAHVLKEV
jgi:hypothetical protein